MYLARQGPLREPKLLEVQYQRLIRYIDCLRDQCDGSIHIVLLAVDFNHPTSSSPDPDHFPEFARVEKAASSGEIEAVFGDFAQYDGFSSFEWIERTLARHGIPLIDGGVDEGGFVAEEVKNRFGVTGEYQPSEAEDLLAFFPGLADRVIYEFLDESERANPDVGNVRSMLDESRRDLVDDKPYRISRLPLYWATKLHRIFRERNS